MQKRRSKRNYIGLLIAAMVVAQIFALPVLGTEIEKSVDKTNAMPGEDLAYTIRVNFTENASNVTISDYLPDGLVNITDSQNGTLEGKNITWDLGDVNESIVQILLNASIAEDYDGTAIANNLVNLSYEVNESTYALNASSPNIRIKGEGKPKVTFVIGTDANLQPLLNASQNITINSTMNVSIYNATTVPADLSEQEVIFLASLSSTTIAGINDTITDAKNNGAYVIAFNLTEDIGNVDDINITKYWVYGGDENIRNLIIYMDNEFFGSATEVNPPKPPENRPKIAFVTAKAASILLIESAKDDPNIAKSMNITAHFTTQYEPASYQNLNLSDQNVIMLVYVGFPVLDGIKQTVNEAKENGAYVIVHMLEDVHNLGNVNLSYPAYSNITKYWNYGGEENIKRLITFLGVKFCNVSMEMLPPMPTPLYGIYHPNAPRVFENASDYFEWYNSSGRYNPSSPTVGIHSYDVSRYYAVPDALIVLLEEKGVNVIFATYTYKDLNSSNYFIQNNKSIVDVAITLTAMRLNYKDEEMGIEYLKNLDVTPLKGITTTHLSSDEWENSTGLPSDIIAWQIALPELDGLTDFIFVGGETKDPISGLKYHEPVDYQIDWITDRAISWAELHRMNNSEKRIAIIYYNHGGGKDNLGASYLDITPSLKNLLDAMKERGYEIEGEVPEEKELLGLMIRQGRNIGTWVPGELKNMVENESVVLIPVEEYESWFNELPANKRQEVIDKWGEPPGEIMVYENETGKYIVIPSLSFGNVLLAPQPTRGWLQDNKILYHDKELVPHHQYIAFYFWLKKEFDADAIIHFGTHGTQEWLPGKETTLSIRECWPAILIQDFPVVYPYIMDNVAEGTMAKRRGNAVIVDHLTPPIIASGLYENLSLLHEKIHSYLSAEELLKVEYRKTIIELYENLSLNEDLSVSLEDLRVMNDTEFEGFVTNELHVYLHELADEFIPYGLPILGTPPNDWKLVSMVKSMLGKDFLNHVAEIYPDPHVLNPAHGNCTVMEELLREVIFNGSSPEDAQEKVLGLGNVSSNVTDDLNTSIIYAENIRKCTIEIPRILEGLAGRYIPPKVGNDPIRTPDALPTGNNFYSFDPRLKPDKEAWEVGKQMADDLLRQYQAEHNGTYPRKIAFVLWAIEGMRHQGTVESQIFYLLGVKPVWDSKGRVKNVELINSSELGRPRIDILTTTSGLYRDTFPDKIKLIDKAVRLAAEANDTEYPNYVKENSQAIYELLIANGYNESDAQALSMSRIFCPPLGSYGTGIQNAIPASSTWENESEIADLYINRMSNIYGSDSWGETDVNLFRQNLAGVEIAIHSRSSNLYGMVDSNGPYQFLGGLALAVRSITGETPDLYVTNLRDLDNPKIETLKSFLQRELHARYFNPKWIEGMMEHDYAGAREMMKFAEDLWGWDVTTPDLITESMWNQVYDVYVQDKYDMGLEDWFNENNPWARQSMTARMLEAIRKGYWDPSDEVKTALAETYTESVEEYGVTCCHHTCGNPNLKDKSAEGILSMLGVEPTEQTEEESTTQNPPRHGGGGRRIEEERGLANETVEVSGVSKVGEELKKPPEETGETAEKVKKGKVMKEEEPASSLPTSGAPLMGLIAVVVILVFVGIGFWVKARKR